MWVIMLRLSSKVFVTHAREQAASEDVAAGLSSDAVAHVKNAVDHPVHRKVHLRKGEGKAYKFGFKGGNEENGLRQCDYFLYSRND